MTKGILLCLLCGALASCATHRRRPTGSMTGEALTRGFLIVSSQDETSPVVEIQLRKNGSALRVQSFKEAAADSVPDQVCDGEGVLKGQVAFLRIHCPSESHVFEIDFQGAGPAELEQGTEVRVRSPATQNQWVPLTAQRRERAVFR